MPDNISSSILNGPSSFDSIFALELDTKQRFDNILSGQQKPIEYPIPEYTPSFEGLPQDEILSPKTYGSLGEALFSPNPKIAELAVAKLNSKTANAPVSQGVGVPERFTYDKSMDKYLKGDFGYNPYISIEDNEEFNYKYDYLNKSIFERIPKNIGVGLGRFTSSLVFKLGQTVGYIGSMIGNSFEELIDSKNNNFMSDVADNSLSRWFEGVEEDWKSSNALSVFKPKGWEDKGFFAKLGNGAFWTDEVADGAAFMGEMVASMYLLGGLGRIGAVGRFASTPISMSSRAGRFAPLVKYIDKGLRLSTGADDLGGVGRWAFSVASESAFEASGTFKEKKDELIRKRSEGLQGFANLSDEEINKIAGDTAAASFKGNMLVLSASNAFENRFIFSPLFKRMGLDGKAKGPMIGVSKDTSSLDNLAKASLKENTYKTWLGKKLDWKNSNSRLRFYGSKGLSSTAMEGFWEENAQLAIERLSAVDNLSIPSFFSKLGKQTVDALTGDDPEAATSIGLGAIIGIGGTSLVSKVRGGNALFQGERKANVENAQKAINTYEKYRKEFLNVQDIYITDPDTGKPVLDGDGNLQIDPIKSLGLIDGISKFSSKLDAINNLNDPLLRKKVQDSAMKDYVFAAKSAGIFDVALSRFENIESLDKEQLQKLGFDPNTTVDVPYLKNSLRDMGKIHDKVMNGPSVRLRSSETIDDENARKYSLYSALTEAYSAGKISEDYRSVMMDKSFPSVFSPEATGNISEVQEYNTLIYRINSLQMMDEFYKENNAEFFRDFIKRERESLIKAKDEIKRNIDLVKDTNPNYQNIQENSVGLMFNLSKFSGLPKSQQDILFDIENSSQIKLAQILNAKATNEYLASLFAHPIDGIKNTKEYIKYIAEIQKKDAKEDGEEEVKAEVVPSEAPAVTEVTAITVPIEEVPLKPEQIVKAENIIEPLSSALSVAYSNFLANTEEVEYDTIFSLIRDNEEKFPEAIQKVLQDFFVKDANLIISKIADNTFKEGDQQELVNKLSFLESTEPYGEDMLAALTLPFVESLYDTVNSAINYKKPKTSDQTEIEKALPNLQGVIRNQAEEALKSEEGSQQFIKDIANQALNKIAPDTTTNEDALTAAFDTYTIELVDYAISKEPEQAPPVIKASEPVSDVEAKKIEINYNRNRNKEQKNSGAPVMEGENGKWLAYYTPEKDKGYVAFDTQKEALAWIDSKYDAELAALQGEPKESKVKLTQDVKDKINTIFNLTERGQISLAGEDYDLIRTVRSSPTKENVEKFLELYNKEVEGYEKSIVEGVNDTEARRKTTFDNFFLEKTKDGRVYEYYLRPDGTTEEVYGKTEQEVRDKINAMYDKELGKGGESDTEEVPPPQVPPSLPPSPVPPAGPPSPPEVMENSDEEEDLSTNFLDIVTDEAKRKGGYILAGLSPDEIIMEGDKPKIVGGAVQLKSTQGDQQRQMKRQHNIMREMGSRTNPINFWSEDSNGEKLYQIKLIEGNEELHSNWIYNPVKGKTNDKGVPYKFPFIIAVVVDKQGNPVNFADNGLPSETGTPFAFTYDIQDYYQSNLNKSRKGRIMKTGEPLNGVHGFVEGRDPASDLARAVLSGKQIFGEIMEVTSGKLSSYSVSNSFQVRMKKNYTLRTVKQMIEDGDISDTDIIVLKAGAPSPIGAHSLTIDISNQGSQSQQTKIGQPYLYDSKSRINIPLRGKKIKDLTLNGKPFVTGQLLDIINELDKTNGYISADPSPLQQQKLSQIYDLLRVIFFTGDLFVQKSEDGSEIRVIDNRPQKVSILETELNFSVDVDVLYNPISEEEISYSDFAKENFVSGAIPAEVEKGQKTFEKLNKRVIFALNQKHQDLINAADAATPVRKPVQVKPTNYSQFVGKTYKAKGRESTITIESVEGNNFVIKGPSGTVKKKVEDFMKDIRNLEEVTLPTPTEEVISEMQKDISLTKEEIAELNEKAKNMTDEDVDNLDFGC